MKRSSRVYSSMDVLKEKSRLCQRSLGWCLKRVKEDASVRREGWVEVRNWRRVTSGGASQVSTSIQQRQDKLLQLREES